MENICHLCRLQCLLRPHHLLLLTYSYLVTALIIAETAGRSLEDLDVIFAAGGNPVKVEKAMPRHHIDHNEARRALGLASEENSAPGSVQSVNIPYTEKA